MRKKTEKKTSHTKNTPPSSQDMVVFSHNTLFSKLEKAAKKNDRNQMLSILKEALIKRHQQAKHMLIKHNNGSACAGLLSHMSDSIIACLCRVSAKHLFAHTLRENTTPCLIATGGYGYGMMAPQSDLDLVFLMSDGDENKKTGKKEDVKNTHPLIEFILYMLWDMGLNVGYAIRNIDESVHDIAHDHTICTTFLQIRKIWGSDILFDKLDKKLNHWWQQQNEKHIRKFIKAKLDERDARHHTTAISRYLTEPDVKKGKGGLRDINTLYWISLFMQKNERKKYAPIKHNKNTHKDENTPPIWKNLLTKKEIEKLKHCESFLWAVRCHLHFICGRNNNCLSFDYQEDMAQCFGFVKTAAQHTQVERKTSHNPNEHIEKFMKQYFLTAKQVGDLTRIFCAVLEIRNIKEIPQQKNKNKTDIKQFFSDTDFIYERGRISFKDPYVCKRNPTTLISLFQHCETIPIHPDALRQTTRNLHLIDNTLRKNPHANKIFTDILVSSREAEKLLRRMNEAGVLGRFIPDFGKIIAHMQFDMYHHYTVDEHLFRTIGFLKKIEQGLLHEHHPLCSKIIHKIKYRRALYVAAFLHDIAKGRKEHHAIAGEKITKKLAPRLGLNEKETHIAAWLVRHHLLMSETSQKRDIRDPLTITQFCNTVKTVEELRLLLILTVADIRAVGPKVWAGWMGHLLRDLYFLAKEHLETQRMGQQPQITQKNAVKKAWEIFVKSEQGRTTQQLQKYKKRHYESYWISHTLEQQNMHIKLIENAEKYNQKTSIFFKARNAINMDEYMIYTDDHAYLLAALIGTCAANGMNVIGAKIYTTKDGKALDTLYVKDAFLQQSDYCNGQKAKHLSDMLKNAAKGTLSLEEIAQKIKTRQRHSLTPDVFPITTTVSFDNETIPNRTIIEISSPNDAGSLFSFVRTLSDLNLNIASAHMRILGIRREGVFYVNHMGGKKLTSQTYIKKAKKQLHKALLANIEPQPPIAQISPSQHSALH